MHSRECLQVLIILFLLSIQGAEKHTGVKNALQSLFLCMLTDIILSQNVVVVY